MLKALIGWMILFQVSFFPEFGYWWNALPYEEALFWYRVWTPLAFLPALLAAGLGYCWILFGGKYEH